MIIIFAEKNDQIDPHSHGRNMLNGILKKAYPGSNEPIISKNENGKPFIQNYPEFCFNISHSGEWTVLAVSDQEIGVDIQKIKPVRSNIPKRFFTRRENLFLDNLNNKDYCTEFTRIWTLKEARTKASGESLAKTITKLSTIDYDGTFSKIIDGYYVENIPFPDDEYLLSVSSVSPISDNYYLKIQ
ncbi:MAG: 4'-phosphopantetheinyl transferase superfamily protein [Clostridia bacterium]|nr:4'-phosphopantetheinyl transferase superfamily protein [Clostridia bacterium]